MEPSTSLQEVLTEFVTRLRPDLSVARLSPRDSLLEEGILDSMFMLQLIAFLEERFSITIDADEIVPEHFETLERIAELVAAKLEQA